MNESKSIFLSLTFWSVIVGALSEIARRYGITFDAAGLANDFVSLAAAGLAIYGRLRAVQRVHIINPGA